MSKGHNWDMITAEMTQHHCQPPMTLDEIQDTVNDQVIAFSKDLLTEVNRTKNINSVKPKSQSAPVKSAFQRTAWSAGTHTLDSFTNMSAAVLGETAEAVLRARGNLLGSWHAMDLRFSVWLAVDLWLEQSKLKMFGTRRSFVWWDLCEDQTPEILEAAERAYPEEMLKRAADLFAEGMEDLTELGNLLTRSRALVNNRDAPPQNRVISAEAKAIIDTVLEVGRHVETTAKADRIP